MPGTENLFYHCFHRDGETSEPCVGRKEQVIHFRVEGASLPSVYPFFPKAGLPPQCPTPASTHTHRSGFGNPSHQAPYLLSPSAEPQWGQEGVVKNPLQLHIHGALPLPHCTQTPGCVHQAPEGRPWGQGQGREERESEIGTGSQCWHLLRRLWSGLLDPRGGRARNLDSWI